MNVKITNYLKSVLKSSLYPVIPFKDNNFVSLTYDELLENPHIVDSTHPLSSLLNEIEFNKIFGEMSEKEKKNHHIVQINCVNSYKTLKTNFLNQTRYKKYIPELTGVFYFYFTIQFIRVDEGAQVTWLFDKDNLPWYARSFMTPKYMKSTPDVATVKNVDEFKSNTTERRAKIKTWNDYIEYCDDLFNSTADLSLKYEDKCFVFKYDMNKEKITDGILQLYEKIETNINDYKLYNKFINTDFEQLCPLISNDNLDATCSHCGQMNGEFPLAFSQRQAVHHANMLNESEILAVSGPPGTGKTTLLQSLVADMVVGSVLKSEEPPIIVATSANNQAVTNIIDSFSRIEQIGIRNLEKRWINGVNSFVTYMPSSTKEAEAKRENYQYTTIRGREFIQEAEDKIEDSIIKMKDCASAYFDKTFSDINEIKNELTNRLLLINNLKKELLFETDKVNKVTQGKELIYYKKLLEQSKIDAERKHFEYINRFSQWNEIYEKISKIKRIFSFLPYLKNQVSTQLSIELLPEEVDFFDNTITFSKISEKYNSLIQEKNQEISTLNKKINEVEQLVKCVSNILRNLQEKNCNFKLLENDNLIEFDVLSINDLIDKNIRYIEFWLAIHINECRFLNREFSVTQKQRGTSHKNVLEKFYKQIALISPCFVMTVYKMPSNFKCFDGSYLFNYINLLIFDEAGQCSPEIAASQFSFAKKAIVVGDEYQIPPVHNLDLALDITLAIENGVIEDDEEFDTFVETGLSCSQGSVMTVAKKSCKYSADSNVHGLFLCEHRRCYDEIINYCNELVYDGLLIPMRNKNDNDKGKKRVLNEKQYPYMGLHNIKSTRSQKIGTSRINKGEAAEIAKWLKVNYDKIYRSYQNAKSDINPKNIVAIVTPFSLQASLIRRQLRLEMGEMAENISVGTVHTFQGAERNIIIFSTVYGSADKGVFIDNNRNLMNVAVSRAKDAFWVFGDMEFLKNKPLKTAGGLLYNKIASNLID